MKPNLVPYWPQSAVIKFMVISWLMGIPLGFFVGVWMKAKGLL